MSIDFSRIILRVKIRFAIACRDEYLFAGISWCVLRPQLHPKNSNSEIVYQISAEWQDSKVAEALKPGGNTLQMRGLASKVVI
jgi:hypothetical protein